MGYINMFNILSLGVDMLIPGMKTVIDVSTEYGVESVVIGMPHRGRYDDYNSIN